MKTKLIRINDKTAATLTKLAQETGLSEEVLLEKAIKAFEVEILMKSANKAYRTLKDDPVAWAEHQEELALWDVTLSDGLEDEE